MQRVIIALAVALFPMSVGADSLRAERGAGCPMPTGRFVEESPIVFLFSSEDDVPFHQSAQIPSLESRRSLLRLVLEGGELFAENMTPGYGIPIVVYDIRLRVQGMEGHPSSEQSVFNELCGISLFPGQRSARILISAHLPNSVILSTLVQPLRLEFRTYLSPY